MSIVVLCAHHLPPLLVLDLTKHCRFHMGSGRCVPRRKNEEPKIHRTVKTRMEAKNLTEGPYKCKATWAPQNPKWVGGCEHD